MSTPVRVLLVDDNELDRDMLSRRLIRRGFDVLQSADGGDALERAQREHPDLVLLDTSLPVRDGLSVTRELKAGPNTRDIPVLILTARATVADREQITASGCDDFDTKPVDLQRLLGKIEVLLANRAPRGERSDQKPELPEKPQHNVPREQQERSLELSPLTIERLSDIRRFVANSLTDLGCASASDALVLAVDEVCANLVQHANAEAFPAPTRITVRRAGRNAILTVEDRGRAFNPADASPPNISSDLQDRAIGGLGWFLVRQMVDDLEYLSTSDAHGALNRLTLLKRNVTSSEAPVAPT